MDFIAAHAILAVDDHPHRKEPLVESKRGVFKNGAGLARELTRAVLATALPAVVLRLKENVLAPATRSGDSFGPAVGDKVLTAVVGVGEVEDCFLQSIGAVHEPSMPGSW